MELGENPGGKQFCWFHRDGSIFIDFSNQGYHENVDET